MIVRRCYRYIYVASQSTSLPVLITIHGRKSRRSKLVLGLGLDFASILIFDFGLFWDLRQLWHCALCNGPQPAATQSNTSSFPFFLCCVSTINSACNREGQQLQIVQRHKKFCPPLVCVACLALFSPLLFLSKRKEAGRQTVEWTSPEGPSALVIRKRRISVASRRIRTEEEASLSSSSSSNKLWDFLLAWAEGWHRRPS